MPPLGTQTAMPPVGPPWRALGHPPSWRPREEQAVADGVPIVHVTQGTAAGLAVTTLTPSQADLDRLVGTVLHDPSFRRRSRALAADLADAPDLAGVVAVVESHLPGRPAQHASRQG